MSRREVARVLGVSTTTVHRLIAERKIPVVRFRGWARVPRAALEAWLEARTKEALAAVREARQELVKAAR